MNRRKKAFTLIELLVVIAIIAILAAILFPVFAQAKAQAKSAVCLSNLKQQTLAVLMYNNDYDDLYPNGQMLYGTPATGFWAGSGFIGYQYPCGQGEWDCAYEGDATQPYIKNMAISTCPAISNKWNIYGYSSSNAPQNYAVSTSYTFNGDLNNYSATAATNPTLTVMFWSGSLNNAWTGRTMPSPSLICNISTEPCAYTANPTGSLSSSTNNGVADAPTVYDEGNYTFPSYSKWIHNNGDNMSNLDGHVKYHHLLGGVKEDPWAYTGLNGLAMNPINVFPVYTNGPGGTGHMCLFGPDDPCGL